MRLDELPHRTLVDTSRVGHAHFWERAISRRSALRAGAAAGLALASSRLLRPAPGWAASAGDGAEPRPIPGGFATVDGRRWHAYPPGPSNPLDPASVMNEPNVITDFDGVVTVAQIQGTGTEYRDGRAMALPFDADMRIIAGRYVALDGLIHEGTFGFV